MKKLNLELVNVSRWLNDNTNKVNIFKSNLILHSYKYNLNTTSLALGSDSIVQNDSAKMLGVIIDENLNFKLHLNKISSKIF